MSSVKVADGLYSVGILNPNLRVFDIVMKTDYGTSYNAYIVKGSEKTALVETNHKTYFQHFLNNIREICEPEKLDYVILNHNEPDHSGALAELVKINPQIKIVVSQAGSIYIKNITNNPNLNVQVVKDGDSIDLGDRVLSFINAPFLHWPDSMFTWDEKSKTLFSCDFLGSHYCEPQVFDYNMVYPQKYESAFRGYYDAIFGPFKPYVLKGLEKIADLDVLRVCPSHGPILTKGCRLEYTKECYAQWSAPVKNERVSIPIFYTSAYGNTRKIAQAICEGVKEILPNADCEVFDIIDYDLAELGEKLNHSDAFAIGTPTINRDAVPPVHMLLAHLDAINNQKKPCLAFGSFGWSGEGVPNVISRLNSLKLSVFGEGFKVTFVPSEEDLEKAKVLGGQFASQLKA